MAPKRPLESSSSGPEAKKPKHGFRVGPENLPDGPWRRKVTRIKKELIQKAKVKKAYAKIKAREDKPADGALDGEDDGPEADGQMHPTRQLMLVDEEKAQAGAAPASQSVAEDVDQGDGHRRRTRRPGYYDKQLQKAEERRAESEARAAEAQRRREERAVKLAERERHRRAMAKTRGADGRKKLGRESSILLDKVRKMVAEG